MNNVLAKKKIKTGFKQNLQFLKITITRETTNLYAKANYKKKKINFFCDQIFKKSL